MNMDRTIRVFIALVIGAACVWSSPGVSDAKIEMTGSALVSAQDVDFDTTSGALDEDFNFNDPRVNLYVNADVTDRVSVFTHFWIGNDWSNDNHTAGAPANGGINNKFVDAVSFVIGYVSIKDVFGLGLDLKIGNIEIPYGWEQAHHTHGADDRRNDFVTNSLLDINGYDPGVLLSGSFEARQNPISWEFGVFNGGVVNDGSPSGTSGQSRSNDDLALAVRAETRIDDRLSVQASYYQNDSTRDGDHDPLKIGSALFITSVSRAPGGGLAQNANLRGLTYIAGADGGGYDREMWEVSGKYDFDRGYLLAFWGNIDADSITVNAGREWNYYGLQGRYDLNEQSYLAARWNRLDLDYNFGVAGLDLGKPALWTVAAGYALADNARLKVEWSSFDEDGPHFGNLDGSAFSNGGSQDADALTVSLGVSF